MKTLFDQKAADFTEIYSNPDVGVENLYVSNVCHKAIIEVNEQGTKAVGVTRELIKAVIFSVRMCTTIFQGYSVLKSGTLISYLGLIFCFFFIIRRDVDVTYV